MQLPEWASIEFSLPSGSDETYELFQSWLRSANELMVVGLDARRIDRLNDFASSISADERWHLTYEVIAINSDTVQFNIYVHVENGNVAVEFR